VLRHDNRLRNARSADVHKRGGGAQSETVDVTSINPRADMLYDAPTPFVQNSSRLYGAGAMPLIVAAPVSRMVYWRLFNDAGQEAAVVPRYGNANRRGVARSARLPATGATYQPEEMPSTSRRNQPLFSRKPRRRQPVSTSAEGSVASFSAGDTMFNQKCQRCCRAPGAADTTRYPLAMPNAPGAAVRITATTFFNRIAIPAMKNHATRIQPRNATTGNEEA